MSQFLFKAHFSEDDFMASARFITAGDRETGTLCVGCGREIAYGQAAALCDECGAVHHADCWRAGDGCQAYECSTGKRQAHPAQSVMHISRDELLEARPLVASRPLPSIDVSPPEPKRWNQTAIWAFATALVGIPLFGFITGLVAMILGCIALTTIQSRQRGLGLAILGVVLGLADVLGWAVCLGVFYYGDSAQPYVEQPPISDQHSR